MRDNIPPIPIPAQCSGEVILTAKRNKMEKTIRIFSPISESDPSIAESECIGIANYDMMGSRFMLHETDEEGNARSGGLGRFKQCFPKLPLGHFKQCFPRFSQLPLVWP